MESSQALARDTHAQVTQGDLFEFEIARWPRKPYCTDDLEDGIRPRTLAHAINKKYIQANPPHLRIWSIHDLDYPNSVMAWEDKGLPVPNWGAVNKENGHSHLAYGLSVPVLVDSPNMRQGPLRYLCAVENAFREALNADQGYSGLITKNPAHSFWRVLNGPKEYYDLAYLSEFVDLKRHLPKRGKNPEKIGLGRNATLFEDLRMYAYKNIKQYKHESIKGWSAFQSHLNLKALEINAENKPPLDGKEVWCIAKSVAKWTWHKFDIEASDKRFSKLQAHRGIKSGEARLLASENKRATAILMRANGMSLRDIAAQLSLSKSTVHNWIKCPLNHNQITAS